MKLLVTGGTGFVGQYLVSRLLTEGHQVRCLVRNVSHAQKIFVAQAGIEFVDGDITVPDSLKGIASGIEIVYHLAAMGHVSAVSEEAFRQFVAVNVGGTRNLLEVCGRAGIKKFIHFSSTAAMGLIKKNIVDEADTPQPVTPYQKSKYESEMIALSLGDQLGIPTIVLRPCMIYGVGGKGEFFKISQLMRKGVFPKVGSGRNLTPLVHVSDVVQAALLAAAIGRAGEIYLIASERSLAMDELREMIMIGWDRQSMYPYVPVWLMNFAALMIENIARISGTAPIVTQQNIASTIWDREFNVDKARRELGYRQSVEFSSAINETVKWYGTACV